MTNEDNQELNGNADFGSARFIAVSSGSFLPITLPAGVGALNPPPYDTGYQYYDDFGRKIGLDAVDCSSYEAFYGGSFNNNPNAPFYFVPFTP